MKFASLVAFVASATAVKFTGDMDIDNSAANQI
jgi:hypothetical protein